ncbi:unnamed protein product [Chrysoparadoxa australica]
MSTHAYVEVSYFLHHAVDLDLAVRIARLELPPSHPEPGRSDSELMAAAQVYSDGVAMHQLPVTTHTPSRYDKARHAILWDDSLIFPVRYRDLSRNAMLVVLVWDVQGLPVRCSAVPLIDSRGALKQGRIKLRSFGFEKAAVHRERGMEGSNGGAWQEDPGSCGLHKWYNRSKRWGQAAGGGGGPGPGPGPPSELVLPRLPYDDSDEMLCAQDHLFQLEKMAESYSLNRVPRVAWLDQITFRRAKQLREGAQRDRGKMELPFHWPTHDPSNGESSPDLSSTEASFFVLELPSFAHPVLHQEKPYHYHIHQSLSQQPQQQPQKVGKLQQQGEAEAEALGSEEGAFDGSDLSGLMVVTDYEDDENPCEVKYRRMAHDQLRGLVDPDMKPNKEEREKIDGIIASHSLSDHLRPEDKDLLWQFRYCLTDNKKAVTKFLLSVDWDVEDEVVQVSTLLTQWKARAPIDVADALKLLGREKAFQSLAVRRFAVEALERASDEELLAFMPQLVQALRYESAPDDDTASRLSLPWEGDERELSPLAECLVNRSCHSNGMEFASYLYWNLLGQVEAELGGREKERGGEGDGGEGGGTASAMYKRVFNALLKGLDPQVCQTLHVQEKYIKAIADAQKEACAVKGRKAQKEERLRELLEQPKLKRVDADFIPLPINPSIMVKGIVPATAFMFKSCLYPCVVEFLLVDDETREGVQGGGKDGKVGKSKESSPSCSPAGSSAQHATNALPTTAPPRTYKVIFKSGDDLRQDQLIIQLISIMDRLLKRVNLDLKLQPYQILATGRRDGLVQFVEGSLPVSAVLSGYNNSILEFLRHHNPSKSKDLGVSSQAIDTFVKSTAGYCVITYLLGIGDRHLDNLMLLPQGNLFHIDFGYILGRDPKPMAAPFRLTREMIEAMGGPSSPHYEKFKTYCCQAYIWLRRSASLTFNLLSLMVDAGIEELSEDPETVLSKVSHAELQLFGEIMGSLEPGISLLVPRVGLTLTGLVWELDPRRIMLLFAFGSS